MLPNDRSEFLKELEATKEAYVRRKVLLGSYQGWQLDTVKQWLAQQQAEREEEDAKHRHFWLTATGFLGAVGGALGAIATLYMALIPK